VIFMKILCELCGYWICTFSTSSQWGGFRKNMDDLQERQQITQNLLFLHAKLVKRRNFSFKVMVHLRFTLS